MQTDTKRSGRGGSSGTLERRTSYRQPFNATVELTELGAGHRVTARTTDLGLQGCYVDTLNPFPEGTKVCMRVHHADATFEAVGTVIYRHPALGMGIIFSQVKPDQLAILENWLGEKTSLSSDAFESDTVCQEQSASADSLIGELIQLLFHKGVLTPSEAAELLRKARR